ncbi:MAG: hypothetical protein ACFHWX_22240 [Bacteroidota bacterium]
MPNLTQQRFRNLGQAIGIYMGGAWVIIEASGFLIERYDLDYSLLDLLIISCVCLLPSVGVFFWFEKKFSWWAISIYTLNILITVFALRAFLLNPLSVNPNDLRVIKLSGWESDQFDPEANSIVILPFENNTGNAEHEYLIAGIHDGLINEIGLLDNFRVISRTSTLPFHGSNKSIKNIANELHVKSVMESSLSIIGDQVELRLKLFNAFPEEKLIWSNTYEASIGELPTLYRKVTRSVASELAQKLSPNESRRLNQPKSFHPDAYDAYLKGIHYTGFLTREGFSRAEEQYLLAIEIDSTIAPMAYGGLSLMWISIRQMGKYPILEATKKVNHYFNKQINADSTSRIGEPAILTWQRYEWEKAENAWKRELKNMSNDAGFRSAYAHYLMIIGRWDEAWQNMNYALEIDPTNPWVIAFSGVMYLNEGKIITGQKKFELLAEMIPNHPMALQNLFAKYYTFGEEKKAIYQLKLICKIQLESDMDEFIDQTFQNNEFKSGVRIMADRLYAISETSNVPNFLISLIYRLEMKIKP